MDRFILPMLCLGIMLIASAYSGKPGKQKCKNPVKKIGESSIKDCFWRECKKSGNGAKWSTCPKAATEEFVEKKMHETEEFVEKKLNEMLEQIIGNMSSPVNTNKAPPGGCGGGSGTNTSTSPTLGSGCESESGIYTHFITQCIHFGIVHVIEGKCEKLFDGNLNRSASSFFKFWLNPPNGAGIKFNLDGPLSANTVIFKNENVNDFEISFFNETTQNIPVTGLILNGDGATIHKNRVRMNPPQEWVRVAFDGIDGAYGITLTIHGGTIGNAITLNEVWILCLADAKMDWSDDVAEFVNKI